MNKPSANGFRDVEVEPGDEQGLTRLLAEETRRIQADTQEQTRLMRDANALLESRGLHAEQLADDEDASGEASADDEVAEAASQGLEGKQESPERDGDKVSGEASAREEDRPSGSSAISDEEIDAVLGVTRRSPKGTPHPDLVPDPNNDPGEDLADIEVDEVEDDDIDYSTVEPHLIPVDPTVLRPVSKQTGDEHLVVRNTRDYDHDAQSTNIVKGAENFETIAEEADLHDVRRDPYARSKRRGHTPGEGNSRGKGRPFIAMLLVAAVLVGGGAVLTYGMELWGGKSVPYVVGESQSSAETRIAEKGMTVRVEAEPADDAIGRVLRQSPESGLRVPEGSEVVIVVAANRTVPEVVGMMQDEAQRTLEAAGAEIIDVQTRPSGQPEGTVIEISPAAGSAFVSRSKLTLYVATPFRVPDVLGKKENDAVEEIKATGLNAEIVYITSPETVRTVVETSPAPDEIIEEGGTVQVMVSSPYPTDIHHLAEFFMHAPQDIDQYLQREGFSFDKGTIDTLGNALQTYTSNDQGNITFTSQPYNHSVRIPAEGSSNVMSTGTYFDGVRLDCPGWMVPGSIDKAALEKLAGDCALGGMSETCDNKTIKLPADAKKIDATFACASGSTDDVVWTVLVVGKGGTNHASVTCANKDLYAPSDLQPFGGSLAQYVAYHEVYLSSEYQVKEEAKKDEGNGEQKTDDNAANNGDTPGQDGGEAQG